LWQKRRGLVNSSVKRAPNHYVLPLFSDGTQTASSFGKMGAGRTLEPKAQAADNRGLRIIAKSVYRELRNSGHSRSDIVAFTNAVLELVTTELRDAQEAAE